MVTEKIKELEQIEARAAELKVAIESERNAELSALPARFGYDSVESLIKALREATGGRKAKAAKVKGPKTSTPGTRKRAKITPELKEQLKGLVAEGKTGADIAAALGISIPSVQNIKKELGLVKARS